MFREIAPAKINLALHVTGQREDGYHLLHTLVTFADFGDVLKFEASDKITLNIDGPYAAALPADDNNLVLQAAQMLAELSGRSDLGATITLTKNLPIASGIGGGSADAAAAMRGLCKLWSLDLPDDDQSRIALSLGADVPMCLVGEPLRASGIGDDITSISLPSFPIILVNPNVPISTPQIFAGLERKDNRPLGAMPVSDGFDDWLSALQEQRNDLQTTAMQQGPAIASCLAMLERSGAELVRMSGSGATCFGLFKEQHAAKTAAQAIETAHPHWWVADGRTV